MADVRFLLSGDSSVTVEFGNEISPAINAQIRAFTIALEESKLPGIVEVVPTYRSLMVHAVDPRHVVYEGPAHVHVERLDRRFGHLQRLCGVHER